MHRHILSLLLLSLAPVNLLADPGADFTSPPGVRRVDSLVAAERAFAALASAANTRDAFLAVLDDSSVMFRPHPTNGRSLFAGQPIRTTLLVWEPSFAEVSSSGEFGYTCGPWSLAERATPDSILGTGHFVTFWRVSEGRWKVLLDVGISHPSPAGLPEALVRGDLDLRDAPGRTGENNGTEPRGGSDDDVAAEDRYHADLLAMPAGAAGRKWMSADVRLFRDGRSPFVGLENALKYIDSVGGRIASTRFRIWTSRAGDLSCSYGSFSRRIGETVVEHGYYVRMWRREAGRMRLSLELWSSIPLSEELKP